MGSCVGPQDKKDHEVKYTVRQQNAQRTQNKGSPKKLSDPNRLTVPSNSTGRNLFKTFSDWDDTQDHQQIEKNEEKKIKRRRYSQDLKVVTKFGQYRLTMKNEKELKTSDNTKAESPRVDKPQKHNNLVC